VDVDVDVDVDVEGGNIVNNMMMLMGNVCL
jgi:hypothetical protein